MKPVTRCDWLLQPSTGDDMFFNTKGRARLNAEEIMEKAEALPLSEVAQICVREEILRDVLNSFESRLEDVPAAKRQAIRYLLYKEVTDVLFDFRLSLEARIAREQVSLSKTQAEKMSVVDGFAAIMSDVAILHGE